jgi:hypothetical protein
VAKTDPLQQDNKLDKMKKLLRKTLRLPLNTLRRPLDQLKRHGENMNQLKLN